MTPDDGVAMQLAGRWRAFSRLGRMLVEVPVEHEPWPLRDASLEALDESLIAAAGLPPPSVQPLVHFAEAVHARLGRPRVLQSRGRV
jgi:hypothetical protein